VDGWALWDLFLTGLLRGGLYALMALGLSLVFGVINIPQFAHGEFYMLGAYFAYFAFSTLGSTPLVAILFAGAAGFAAGALIEKALFGPLRKRGGADWVMNTFLVTIGLSFVLQNGALAVWGANFRGITGYWSGSLRLGSSMAIPLDRVAGFGLAIGAILAFWLFLGRTRTGRAIRAVAQDETGAALLGIEPDRIRNLAFALSTMLAAIAGGSLLSLNPAHPAMGSEALFKSWFVVILSGLGSVGAAIPGGFLVGILETFGSYFFGSVWQDCVSISIIILILLFRPNGLFASEVRGIWER
jgi:branched-chain amino acid transport system permease protein